MLAGTASKNEMLVCGGGGVRHEIRVATEATAINANAPALRDMPYGTEVAMDPQALTTAPPKVPAADVANCGTDLARNWDQLLRG